MELKIAKIYTREVESVICPNCDEIINIEDVFISPRDDKKPYFFKIEFHNEREIEAFCLDCDEYFLMTW